MNGGKQPSLDRQGREIMVAEMGNLIDQETASRQFSICVSQRSLAHR